MKTLSSKIRNTFLLIASAIAINAGAQNLVPYGDFENYSTLAILLNIPNSCYNNGFPTGWTSPNLGTPDMISDYSTPCNYSYNNSGCGYYPQVCEIDNKLGCQTNMGATYPYTASSHVYMGIYTWGQSGNLFPNSTLVREYVKCTLNVSGGLTAGQCYHLTYYVSRSDMSKYATPVQAVVTSQNIDNTNGYAGVLNPGTAIWCRPSIVYDKIGWTKIDYDFVAQGGETFLYLGFFEDEDGPCEYRDDDPMTCEYTSGMSATAYASSNNNISYYYLDNISLFATAGPTFSADYTFTDGNPNISGTFTGENILISGNVNISANTIFDGCTVKCNTGSTITVPSGKTFEIKNETTIEAGCGNMWEGIIVDGGSLIFRGSTIRDAHTAITFNTSASTWQIYRDAGNHLNYFSRNTVDIVFNGSFATGNTLKATIFDHTTALHDPTQGVGGYGTNNLVFNGPGNSVAETIGSSTSTDGCLFTGGQNAIVSNKFNLKVENCTFSGQANLAIDISGTGVLPQSPLTKLTAITSTFLSAREHIAAYNNVDLTVQGCTLSYAQQNSIEWSNNHENFLRVGDASSSTLGNVFNNNGWYSVVAMHNSTIQTDLTLLAENIQYPLGPAAHYTSLVIANNTINCLPSSSGILIAEWQLGQHVAYSECNVSYNTIYSTLNGICFYNIKGWGNSGLSNVYTPPLIGAEFNMVYTSSSFAANSVGIKLLSSNGCNIRENGISADNPFNYVNNGVYMINSEYTELYGNIVSAGTCASVNMDMYGSNMHCNWFSAYSTGFYMGATWLRGGSAYTHGSPTYEQYNNLVPYTMYPWNSDIYVDNSDVQFNKWVWNGAATNLHIDYIGNTGTGSIISSSTGTDRCENGFPGIAPFGGNVDITFSSDPVAQWIADYNYEIRRRNNSSGSDAVASSNIKALLDIEALIALGEYADALNDLDSFDPDNDVEENYKAVLTIFATLGDEDGRIASDTEKGTLMSIAEQSTRTGGPAVTLARGYLEAKYYLHYSDPRPFEDGEINGTTNLSSPCTTDPAANTMLSFMDDDGNDLEIEGCKVDADGSFIFDPLEIAYHTAANPTTEYRIFSKPGSKYTVVNFEFHTLAEWLTASPLQINLAGVSQETDTITVAPLVAIDTATVIHGEGCTYHIGWVTLSSTNTDMLITKSDGGGILWTRSWSAPREGLDTATCLYIDKQENVYVAGKVDNGHDFDVQILKYDIDGNLIWSSMIADSSRQDDHPTGITVNDEDASVEIVGLYDKDFRYIKVWECLPGTERLGLFEDSDVPTGAASPSFYPNPSNGSLSIDLKGQSGGTLELVNVAGQVIFTEFVSGNREIHLPANIENGVYLLKFTGEGEPYYQKLMIYRNQ